MQRDRILKGFFWFHGNQQTKKFFSNTSLHSFAIIACTQPTLQCALKGTVLLQKEIDAARCLMVARNIQVQEKIKF